MKNKSGITLIALVITIIVLLILATVSIYVITGDNNILTKAKSAQKLTDEKKDEESKILESYEEQIEYEYEDVFDTNLDPVKKILKICNIRKKYTKEDLLNNTDDILKIIFENDSASDIMLEHFFYDLFSSEKSIMSLGQSKIAWNKIASNSNMLKIIFENYSASNIILEHFLYKLCNSEQSIMALGQSEIAWNIITSNTDMLKIIFENDSASDIMLEHFLDKLCNSEQSMIALCQSTITSNKLISSKYFKKLTSNQKLLECFNKNSEKIPNLSSNNDKGFILEGTCYSSDYNLYNAFDNSNNTYWLASGYGNATMTISFPKETKIYHIYYSIGSSFNYNYTATSYELYGILKDGTSKTISTGNIGKNTTDIYFSNDNKYSKYKIILTKGRQSAGASILNIYYK